jgi:ABC-type lipoprotein export system ATPase subunit
MEKGIYIMNITIKKCNNIENACISIKENTLNIKYAINGTGKTTLSHAIFCFSNDCKNGTNNIQSLKPFKYMNENGHEPEVLGAESIKSIRVFDESYVNDFVFLPDELLKGSFDIFIRDDNYDNGMKEIEDLVEILREKLAEDKEIDALINDFNELSKSFGQPTKSGIHGASILSKAFKFGNKVANIPEGLEKFGEFIQSESNYKWIKWQIDGGAYLDISSKCPFCTSNLRAKRKTIKRVSEVYDAKSVENLVTINRLFERLKIYFSDQTNSIIDSFIHNIDGYTEEQVNYLREIKNQIDLMREKFVKVQELGFRSLKDVDNFMDQLATYRININLYSHLQSANTKQKIEIVDKAIDSLLTKARELQGKIKKQKNYIEKLVKENNSEINSFLKNAGYYYHVDIIEDKDGKYKLKLIHNDVIGELSNAKTHLSFGERNAFSLVLFMYDILKNVPDLIVLDDPISSFDKNKKYAIIDMLFRKGKSFRGKTVLLLTHDFEPIVDMVFHHSNRFDPPYAVFLENVDGELTEKIVLRSDIKTFIDINNENIISRNNEISKLVYLRRLCEVTNDKGLAYQLISNLLHKRVVPTMRIETGVTPIERPMKIDEIENAKSEIQSRIPEFDYYRLLSVVKDDLEMKRLYLSVDNNYEKLHIYRIIFDGKPDEIESDIIQKFINQAFHLENEYIYQLNPCKYQVVPHYVIKECDKHIMVI